MQKYAHAFKKYMDENGIKYTEKDETTIRVVYGGDNLETIPIFVIFDEDGDPLVQFKCWDISSFKTNEEAGIRACNYLNTKYRWVKFYIDDDKDVIASIDAMIDESSCGAECLSMVRRIVNIIDEGYPVIVKARWL